LIELIVVFAISLMVFGVVISYGGIGEEQVKLYTETARVVQSVLQSRSLAITAYLEFGLRICGHGVWIIDEKRFALVRYLRQAGDDSIECVQIGAPNQNINNFDYSSDDAVLTVDTLVPGVTFDLESSDTARQILFRPPDPDIYFYDENGNIFDRARESSFYIVGDQGGRMKITIGQGGQVTYGFVQ